MMTDETSDTTVKTPAPPVPPGPYPLSPLPTQWQSLTLTDTVGAIFLGILSVILLIGWRRSELRYRRLITHMEKEHGDDSFRTG